MNDLIGLFARFFLIYTLGRHVASITSLAGNEVNARSVLDIVLTLALMISILSIQAKVALEDYRDFKSVRKEETERSHQESDESTTPDP
ncbi:MAG: hypothetical protein M3Q81_03470 [bacterium]|nr:hypothetical protein [bacterium]